MPKSMTDSAMELETKLIDRFQAKVSELAFASVGEDGIVTEDEVGEAFLKVCEEISQKGMVDHIPLL